MKTTIIFRFSRVIKSGLGGASCSALIGLVLGTACTPTQGKVPNNPPLIEESVQVADFGIQTGYFQPDIFSAFLWPLSWGKQDYLDRVGQIQDDSKKIIGLLVGNQDVPLIQINQLWANFKRSQCIENFQDPSSVDPAFDPTDETATVNFVVLPVVAPVSPVPVTDPSYAKYQEYLAYQAKAKALANCADNQNQRATLHQSVNQFFALDPQPVGVLQAQINDLLGSAPSFNFDVSNSHLTLKPSADPTKLAPTLSIEIKFADLNRTVSTEKTDVRAKIIVEHVALKANRLVFLIPDPSIDNVMYRFDLSRLDSLMKTYSEYEADGSTKPTELAVFQGDLTKLENGAAVQSGQVQIVGKFQAATNP